MRIFWILSLVFSTPLRAAQINVRSVSYLPPERTEILLRDIAEMTGFSSQEMIRLQDSVLGDGPRAGERRRFSAEAVSSILRRYFSQERIRSFKVRIPRDIYVFYEGDRLSPEALASRVEGWYKEQCGTCEVKALQMQLPRWTPAQIVESWSLERPLDLPRGAFSFPLKLKFVGSEDFQTYWVNGNIRQRHWAQVSTRLIKQGEIFRSGDFRGEWVDTTFAWDGLAPRDEISGKKAGRTLREGEVIWKNSLLREWAARRGEGVKVIAKDKGFAITVGAVAQEDGFVGERIKLKNPTTNKVFMAKMSAVGEAELE